MLTWVLAFSCLSLYAGVLCLELVQIGKFDSPWRDLHAVYDAHGDKIFIFGGLDHSGKWRPEIVEFSVSENKIVHVHSSPDLTNRPGGTPVRVGLGDGAIYYFGGDTGGGGEGGGFSNEVSVFNADFSLSLIGRLTTPCAGSSVAWDGGQHVFAFGGEVIGPPIGGATPLVHTLYLVDGSIILRWPLPLPLSSSAAVYAPSAGAVFIFGGKEMIGPAPQPTRNILKYNLDDGKVDVISPGLDTHMQAPCAVLVGEEVFIIGGDALAGSYGNFVNFHTRIYSVAPLPVENFDFHLEGSACAYVETMNRIYIFGGLYGTHVRDEIWFVDLEGGEGPTTTAETSMTTEDTTQATSTSSPSSTPSTEGSSSSAGPSTPSSGTTESEPTESTSTEEAASTPPSPYPGEGSSPGTSSSVTDPGPGPDPPVTTPTSTSTASTPPTTGRTSTPTTKPPPVGVFDCSKTDRFGLLFEAYAGELATNPCPRTNSTNTATWFCSGTPREAKFNGSHPDYRNCTSNWIEILEDLVADGVPYPAAFIRTVLQGIQEAVEDKEDAYGYFGHEIKSLIRVVNGVLGLMEDSVDLEQVEDLSEMALAVYDALLTTVEPWEELSETERAETATTFVASCDSVGLWLGARADPSSGSRYRKSFDAFATEFQVMSGWEAVAGNSSFGTRGRTLTFPERFDPKKDCFIEIPRGWPEYFEGALEPHTHVAFAGFELNAKYVNEFLPASRLNSGGGDATASASAPTRRLVNGKLMSFTFEDPRDAYAEMLSNSESVKVRITLQHDISAWGSEYTQVRRRLHDGERPTAVSGSARCVFWDPEELVWSSSGCWLVSSDRGATVCECSHLTSFAIIMDLHDYVGKDRALELLTLTLCPLSILCLLCSITVFGCGHFGAGSGRRHGRRLLTPHPRHDLTFALCVTLLAANVLILLTLDRHYLHLSDGVCTASAIMLHYTLLLAFSWMALEGILLARLVFIDVFSTGREHARYEKAVAFLVPALVIGVTCAVGWGRGEGAIAYGAGYNDGYCWLGGYYLWSFAGVIVPVLLFNFCVLVMSIQKSAQAGMPKAMKHGGKASNRQSPGFWIRGALSLTVIMGLTWAAGFLMLVGNATVANIAAYLFTIANASQGIFIFVFHVASNREVRAYFGICAPVAAKDGSTSTGSASVAGKSMTSSRNSNSTTLVRSTTSNRSR